ncbi:MAG: DUF1015 domain-containing protein [Spirochaetes bacterium]|nr:DUF1015 domain-containing protein [Spirochaetota bacterium]
MAKIKEFKGLRPAKDLAEQVAELPYDVVTVSEARAIAEKNQYNFYHITRSEVDLPEGTDVYSDEVYDTGLKNLEKFIQEEILHYDEDSLYLYTLVMNGTAQTGLVACVNIEDYENGIVKKHELVLDSKAEDRRRHIDVLNAQTGPVFLFYKDDGKKIKLFEQAMSIAPEYDFTAKDGIKHVLRRISDKDTIKQFKENFSDEMLYIADGHHRALSGVKVGMERRRNNPDHTGNEEYNWFLTVIFPHSELRIMPYNRAVTDLNGLSAGDFLKKLEENFTVVKGNEGVKHHTFGLYMDSWYTLIPEFEIPDDAIEGLDAQILQNTILGPVLNITNPRNDKRIKYVGGIRGEGELERLVNSGEFKAAFSLFPVKIEELIRVSDEDKLMPPKSTWFEPKLRSGLVTHRL